MESSKLLGQIQTGNGQKHHTEPTKQYTIRSIRLHKLLSGYNNGSGTFDAKVPAGEPDAGNTVTFTNIQINPSLPDSLFKPPLDPIQRRSQSALRYKFDKDLGR